LQTETSSRKWERIVPYPAKRKKSGIFQGRTFEVPGRDGDLYPGGIKTRVPSFGPSGTGYTLGTGFLTLLDPLEQSAFVRLQDVVRNAPGPLNATVTGPLRLSTGGFVLEVRQFSVPVTRS
jgi:hypothetical protein